jgi:hypothetical protein
MCPGNLVSRPPHYAQRGIARSQRETGESRPKNLLALAGLPFEEVLGSAFQTVCRSFRKRLDQYARLLQILARLLLVPTLARNDELVPGYRAGFGTLTRMPAPLRTTACTDSAIK